MVQDELRGVGNLTLTLTDEFGNVKHKSTHKNLVVLAGRALYSARLLSNTPSVPSHMAIGTGVTAAAAGNTALGTEISRIAFSQATNTSVTNTFIAIYAAGVGTGAITEAGIFNAASAGTLLCRTVFPVVNKAAVDSLTITWNITIN